MKAHNHLIELLAITEAEYAQLVYETGIKWLNNHFGGTMPESFMMMEQSRLYWNWWKRQWQLRDEELMTKYNLLNLQLTSSDYKERQILIELYTEKHQASMKVYPAPFIIKTIRKQYNLIKK